MTDHQNDQLAALRDSLEKQAAAAEAAFTPHANGHTLVRGAYDTVRAATQEMRTLANTLTYRVGELQADDLMPEAGKQRLLTEARDEARMKQQQLQRKLDGALAVLETAAHAAALPATPRERESLIRDEAVMRMSNASDPLRALEEVASLGGDLSAIAASSWGESYLVAKGVAPREAKRLHRQVVQVAAINAAMQSADARVAGAAKTYFALPEARKAAVIHVNLAMSDLKGAGVGDR